MYIVTYTSGPTQFTKQHEDEAANEDQVVSAPWQPLLLVFGLGLTAFDTHTRTSRARSIGFQPSHKVYGV